MDRKRTLVNDTRGAMMVMAVFMAVFLVACLWYLIGVGDAAVYREQMQDASDAVAFTSAVYHARGMNIIVLMNLVMMALLAVLVALKLIQMIVYIGMIIAAMLNATGFGAIIGAPLQAALTAVDAALDPIITAYDEVQQVVRAGLSIAQTAVARAMPLMGLAESVSRAGDYKPSVKSGLAISRSTNPLVGLPVEEMPFDDLCARSGHFVGELVAGPLGPLQDLMGAAIESLTSSFPDSFCGDSDDGDDDDSSGGDSESADSSESSGGTEHGDVSSNNSAAVNTTSCSKQEKKWLKDTKAWKKCAAKHGASATTPTDPFEGVCGKKPGDFDYGDCEEAREEQQKGEAPAGTIDSEQTYSGKNVAKGARNGNDFFSVYGFVLGDSARIRTPDNVVRLASWNRPVSSGAVDAAAAGAAERVSFSKAEFYYDGAGSWEDLQKDAMWNLRWRARLRRFRLSEGTGSSGGMPSMAGASGYASIVTDLGAAELGKVIEGDYFGALVKELGGADLVSSDDGDPLSQLVIH